MSPMNTCSFTNPFVVRVHGRSEFIVRHNSVTEGCSPTDESRTTSSAWNVWHVSPTYGVRSQAIG